MGLVGTASGARYVSGGVKNIRHARPRRDTLCAGFGHGRARTSPGRHAAAAADDSDEDGGLKISI